ncbi:hypothetical protein IHE45_08G162000 [Dioscorea alata]|uniref:Uncharacterized protein n=1 Tax=Dioscorea alata TaxID=55571 RepID=A0ACB7VP21_DIOAL|nr:hypothetical protein IHE45_08G162000 [Dioscorea alata]
MAFMLGARIVSYGVVGAVAILTHETTKAYKERLYHWARGKFTSHNSPSQPEGPPHAENQPTHQRDAHLSSQQLQQQQQQQQLTVTCEDNDGLTFLPQLQHHQQPTPSTCEEDAHLSVLLQPQQLNATKKDDDTHLSVLQQQQQLTTVDKEDVANLPMLQQQELTAAANNHDACIPVQQQQLTAIGKDDDDVYDLNDDQAAKTSHLIGTEFELKGSSETSRDHEFDDVRIEGGAKHEQQAPRLPGGGATFFAKVLNAAKSQLHGFFCWARGLFEDKRWSTVCRWIARIDRKILLLVADYLFHHTLKGKHPVLRQLLAIIYNKVKKAL